MSKLESLFRQIEIIKVAKKGTFTWEKLSNHLDRKSEELAYNLSISRRTLARDLREIEQLFGLSISYGFKSGSYQLQEKDSWESNIELLESFETIQAFGRRKPLNGKIFFEKRLARGTAYLKPVLDAIQAKESLQVIYQKYWQEEANVRTILPIALKEYKHRWYVIAWNEDKYLRNYGLDRIKSLDRIPSQQQIPEAPD
jgi:predicted DNA-binding transcriptional regulator YafY